VRWRKVYLQSQDPRPDQYAIVELQGEDPLRGNELRWDPRYPEDWGTAYFIFKRTKDAAAGDAVVVLHEHKLTVRHYEPEENGKVCLRSVDRNCPTWTLPADQVNIQGVVVDWHIDLHDSGWA
jgi:hypothetical protein